ncbi:unnamed protein product [Triticum turgidum subsp. durum]|uniref:F-box domain-containing protein n=1 Tax=Triticum turgidum subsp. durum TaxID=4567 RepID=A0A9R1R050_TRITD|nr:unnamed protein product [Triticum turgidum subsp. durum]
MLSCRALADLPPELVCRIADELDDLKCYASAQRTFQIWRSALTLPSPSLLVDHNDDPAKRCITTPSIVVPL